MVLLKKSMRMPAISIWLILVLVVLAIVIIVGVTIYKAKSKKADSKPQDEKAAPKPETSVLTQKQTEELFPVHSAAVINGIKDGITPENDVITYILMQAALGNINMGTKNDEFYIYFKNERISHFLKKWYGILKMVESKFMDKSDYAIQIRGELEKNKIMEKSSIERFFNDL